MKDSVNEKKENKTNEDVLKYTKVGLPMMIDHIDRLLKDSEFLIKKKRYSSSIPLSVLALEEIGKIHIISSIDKLEKPIVDKIWKDITRGGVAHIRKTTGIIFSREKYLEKFDPESEKYIDEMMKAVGMKPIELQMAKIDNMLLKALFLRLEKIKQDCFYTDTDTNGNWINFDTRFNKEDKKSIAYFLFTTALNMHTNQKFTSGLPQKPFKEYSDADKKIMKSRYRKEVNSILKKNDTKKIGHFVDRAMLLINNTYLPDQRGFVKQEGDRWLEF